MATARYWNLKARLARAIDGMTAANKMALIGRWQAWADRVRVWELAYAERQQRNVLTAEAFSDMLAKYDGKG